jgi:hypothetical protein
MAIARLDATIVRLRRLRSLVDLWPREHKRPVVVTRDVSNEEASDGGGVDVEGDPIEQLGRFDVVFCYDLLYHLENPALGLRKLCAVCEGLLLLETIVCDSPLPVLRLEDECLSLNQVLRGIAHRPSPAWLAMTLDRIGLHYAYAAVKPPAHPDFRFDWRDELATARDGNLSRGVFVASRGPLANDHLCHS